jgi:hypothetical protein
MNIIQISEQLKDVPDQFLMQEIQNPTGSYPSYLVVSELTRRKRMREGAVKQEPTTSVAEDLVGISGTPQAAQSTLGAAQQMMAQPQQMPMPEMGMNVPETGTPMMATGGLVAFEQGGPIRAQGGLYVQPFQQLTPYEKPGMQPAGSMGELLTNLIPDLDQAERRIDPVTGEPVTLGEWMRRSEQRQVTQAQTQSPYAPYPDESQRGRITSLNKPMTQGGTAPSAQQKMAGEPRAGGLGAFKMPAPPPAPASLQSLSEKDISRIREAGIAEREEMIPDRTSKLLEERILRKTEQLQKDKDMSFNEALFAAGAAILSAPGGGGMKWAGEGLNAFGQTLTQGKKDMRKSQDLLDQANIDLANAQMLRDQGRLDAADKAERKAQDRIDRSNALLTTQASLARQQWQDQITAAKLPYEIAESKSKAEAQSALAGVYRSGGAGALTAAAKANQPMSAMEVEMAKARVLSDSRYKNASPETVDQVLKQMYGDRYVALPALPPLIRGAETGGATLPGT